jgi:hypothetical protein
MTLSGGWRIVPATREQITPAFIQATDEFEGVPQPFTFFVKGARGSVAFRRSCFGFSFASLTSSS